MGQYSMGFFCYYIHFFHIWYSKTGEKRCYEIMVVTNSSKTFGMSKPLSMWKKNPILFHYFIDKRFYTFPHVLQNASCLIQVVLVKIYIVTMVGDVKPRQVVCQRASVQSDTAELTARRVRRVTNCVLLGLSNSKIIPCNSILNFINFR